MKTNLSVDREQFYKEIEESRQFDQEYMIQKMLQQHKQNNKGSSNYKQKLLNVNKKQTSKQEIIIKQNTKPEIKPSKPPIQRLHQRCGKEITTFG